MNRVAIPNLDIKVWTCKIQFTQGNVLCSLTQPEIKIQRLFEIIYIEYNLIKDEIASMERVEYNTSVGKNVMNVDDIEDFEICSDHIMENFKIMLKT